jgi:hypothetical protein
MLFELLTVCYWLAAATWFGAVLFLVIAPPVILRVVRENHPILPQVLSVNLEGQHGTLLAGSIVAALCKFIRPIETACLVVLGLVIAVQWVSSGASLQGSGLSSAVPLLIRTMIFTLAAGFFLFDWRWVFPRVMKYRQEYLDNADHPEIANAALDQFDRFSQENQSMLRNTLIALLGLLVFSATTMVKTVQSPTITPPAAEVSK